MILKVAPSAPKKFDGVAKHAGAFLFFIINTTSNFNFTVSEFLSLVEANVVDQGNTWYQSHRSEIETVDLNMRVRKFMQLFKDEYLTQSHINEYETQLAACQLKNASLEAFDAHYKKYTEI